MDKEKEFFTEELKKYLSLEGLKYYDEKIKKFIESQTLEWGQLGGERNG